MLVAQVMEKKASRRIFEGLFHHKGSEIHVRPAEYLVLLGTTVDFYRVCAAASTRCRSYLLPAIRSWFSPLARPANACARMGAHTITR
jgi:hypothetical protein